MDETLAGTKEFTSTHAIGDYVRISFGENGTITNGRIAAVKFTDYGKVFYDISLPIAGEFYLLKETDSANVSPEY